MALDKKAKADWQDDMDGRLKKANGVILAEYAGLSVAELTELRVLLKKANAEFRIAKNRLMRRAIEAGQKEYEPFVKSLEGPNGVIYMYGDVAQATKPVVKFIEEHENLKFKAAVIDGQSVGIGDLKAVSELPSKEVLLAQMLGSLSSPARGIVTTLSGVTRNLVNVINAIKDKKQS